LEIPIARLALGPATRSAGHIIESPFSGLRWTHPALTPKHSMLISISLKRGIRQGISAHSGLRPS